MKNRLLLAKYFISFGNRQGSVPFRPIPFDLVAATMAVMLVLLGMVRVGG